MVSPAFRLDEAGTPQGALWGWRVEERWRKRRPLCNGVDRGAEHPAAKAGRLPAGSFVTRKLV